MGIRVCVTGGRNYSDLYHVTLALDLLDSEFTIDELIAGDATGADALALTWASETGVKFRKFKADWETHGKKAGPLRNQQMIDEKPDVLVAFPGGRGTADCVRRAVAAGIPVRFA